MAERERTDAELTLRMARGVAGWLHDECAWESRKEMANEADRVVAALESLLSVPHERAHRCGYSCEQAEREIDAQMQAKLDAQLALKCIVDALDLQFTALGNGWSEATPKILARIGTIVDEAERAFRERDAALAERAPADTDTARLAAMLGRAAFVAEHLMQMIDRETWRESGGDDGQGHYEGDYRAEQTLQEIQEWRRVAALSRRPVADEEPRDEQGYPGLQGLQALRKRADETREEA